jgi:Lon protease-like protein
MESGPLDCLPVFELPGIVFFPHTLLPLHVFEPRYRAMTRDCLEHSLPMAVGSPDQEVLGVGRILRHQEMEDGRFNIVLEGMGRVRLVEELSQRDGYRRFKAEMLTTPFLPVAEARRNLDIMRACLPRLGSRWPEPTAALSELLEGAVDASILADRLASSLCPDPDHRQLILETLSPEVRLGRVVERILELVQASSEPTLEVH